MIPSLYGLQCARVIYVQCLKESLLFINYNVIHCYFLSFAIKRSKEMAFGTAEKARSILSKTDVLCRFSHYCIALWLLRQKIIGYNSQLLQQLISASKCVSQIHSILWKLCKESQCWHTSCRPSGFMTSLSNPSSSSVSSWLMLGSTSSCTFPRVDTRQLRSTTPHLYNSKRYGGLPQCWKTHYVYFCQLLGSLSCGGSGSNWATSHEMKPQEWRENKQTHRFTKACLEI